MRRQIEVKPTEISWQRNYCATAFVGEKGASWSAPFDLPAIQQNLRAVGDQILSVGDHDGCRGGVYVLTALCLQFIDERLEAMRGELPQRQDDRQPDRDL